MLLFGVIGGVSTAIGLVWYYWTPKFWEVGYMPQQPEAGFSHLLHAGKLGMDCRYCHTHVEESPEANIPNVATCYGCHATGRVGLPPEQDARVEFVRVAYEQNESIPWRRVHKLPDYVRNFPHNVHINAGVSCYSCHGMIPNQAVVHQVEPLSMAWCLDCHRNPEPHLVPRDKVTDLFWVRDQLSLPGNPKQEGSATVAGTPGGAELLHDLQGHPLHLLPENCGACHY
jgi:hypothetical protein